ncbi:hypothetical protein Prudu_005928 [Prunus dulcis]|uniref:Uncharacterized protein n=1 Tax=Prunus dulcis TaxID=3755 RepID=A0A4Y1QYU0_PRUDU|nr:hypothetical protein Prudu_005928 [Prunus dulcis]
MLMPHFSNLHRSDEETSLIEVVPIGVYYNISKFQPNWIYLEPSARQRLNQVHRNVMLAAITFNMATSLEPCATLEKQPHMGVKSAQKLRKEQKFTTKREGSLELSRELGAVLGTSLLPSSSSSPLFILSIILSNLTWNQVTILRGIDLVFT